MTNVTAIVLTYDIDATFGCHLWTGKLGDNGRPIIWRGRRPSSAYRVAYEQAGLIVPAEHALDHLCRRERCVNPVHLEPVTKAENERRKSWAYRCKRTRCAHGHDLSDALVTPEMGRLCRTCHGNEVIEVIEHFHIGADGNVADYRLSEARTKT